MSKGSKEPHFHTDMPNPHFEASGMGSPRTWADTGSARAKRRQDERDARAKAKKEQAASNRATA
jgi:hypothetical protein